MIPSDLEKRLRRLELTAPVDRREDAQVLALANALAQAIHLANAGPAGPAAPSVVATLAVIVRGCNALPFGAGHVLVASMAGQPSVSGTTNSSGVVSLPLTALGTWTLSAAAQGRFAAFSGTRTVSAGGTTSTSAQLLAGSGYRCVRQCGYPAPTRLYFVDRYGSVPLDYFSSGGSFGWTSGCFTRSFATTANGTCTSFSAGNVPTWVDVFMSPNLGTPYDLALKYYTCTSGPSTYLVSGSCSMGPPSFNPRALTITGCNPFTASSTFAFAAGLYYPLTAETIIIRETP